MAEGTTAMRTHPATDIAPQNTETGVYQLFEQSRQCQPRTLLVTGATGFMGGHFLFWRMQGPGRCIALVRGKQQANAEKRLTDALDQYALSYGATFSPQRWASVGAVMLGDVSRSLCDQDEAAIQSLTEAHVDDVWHYAATLRFSENQRTEIERHNLQGTRNALALAARIGAKRFILVSTAYAAGLLSGEIPEALHPTGGQFVNAYEELKCKAEHEAQAFCDANGIDLRIIRPSIVVGPSNTHRSGGTATGLYVFLRVLYRMRKNIAVDAQHFTIPATAELPLNMIPIDQAVRDLLYLEQKHFPGGPVYHITAQDELTLDDVRTSAFHNLGLEPPRFADPAATKTNPLEQLFDQYLHSYGVNNFTPKHFQRSIPFRTGITRDDLDAYIKFYYQELKGSDFQSLFERQSVSSADGTPLSAFCAGNPNGPPVVLINAYGMPIEFWVPMGSALRDHYRLISWESRYVPTLTDHFDPTRCGLEVQVEDLRAVLDHFGVASAHLVAWCSGAQVALEFSRQFPERVQKRVLLNGTYCGDMPRTRFQRDFITLVNHVSVDRRRARIYYELMYGKGTQTFQTGNQRDKFLSLFAGVDPFLLHMTSAPFQDPEALFRYASLFRPFFQAPEQLAEQDGGQPTLVVTTPTDIISHPDASLRIAQNLKNGTLLRLPEGDHYALYHDSSLPEQVSQFLQFGGTLP